MHPPPDSLDPRLGRGACHGPDAGHGPMLTHAGGIHWPGYLRRAIAEPESFRVPGFTAVMPVLPLSPEETDDLVAYLMSLSLRGVAWPRRPFTRTPPAAPPGATPAARPRAGVP